MGWTQYEKSRTAVTGWRDGRHFAQGKLKPVFVRSVLEQKAALSQLCKHNKSGKFRLFTALFPSKS